VETPQSANLASLFPELAKPGQRYEVTVTLSREASGEALVPVQDQALAELAAAAVSAEGLLTAWSRQQAVLSMIVDADGDAGALAAGVAVVKALGGARGATVPARPAAGRPGAGL
jgi:hypothetical protein